MLMLGTAAFAADLQGRATIIDGDTLEVAERRVRLVGIDAPELGQLCAYRGNEIDCGLIAKTQLNDLTAAAIVDCDIIEQRADGVAVARCAAGGYDLSEGMVYTGWARADPRWSDRYLADEAESRTAKRGLWVSEFPAPWEWRIRRGYPTQTPNSTRSECNRTRYARACAARRGPVPDRRIAALIDQRR